MEFAGKILNGRFRIGGRTAAGRLFSRYDAEDMMDDNRQVEALFIAPEMMSRRSEDLIRFRSAVRAAAGLRHENILRVYEGGEFFGRAYIITEKTGGVTLAARMTRGLPAVGESIAIARGIAGALAFIHGAGIVHRCLTPGMVLLDPGVKLTGFGIAHIQEFPDILPREDVEETLSYLSPEQCGLLKRPVDERSDLYSAGAIMYRLLTGSLPFSGGDAWSLANLQMAGAPEAPGRINPDIPEVLEAVILKLLEREPDNRYQSAAGLIHDLNLFAEGGRNFVPGLNDRSARLNFRSRLVGRVDELDRLKSMYRESRAGRGSFVLVTGKAGSGKTRLTEELRYFVRGEGVTFIEGKCHRDDINSPYSPFREALDGYVRAFQEKNESQRESIRTALKREFGSMAGIIAAVHPGFSEILGESPPLRELEPESEMKRFLMVLGRFFVGLARVEKGMVLLIDDLQWADTGSRYLIIEMLDGLARAPLLVIGTHREEELPGAVDFHRPPGRTSRRHAHGPGAPRQGGHRALVSGILSENDKNLAEAADIIHLRSQGNPFIAITLLKHLIESGALKYEKRRWRLARPAGDDIPVSIVDIIVERIKELSDREKEIIACAAVIGKEFDFSLLSRTSGLDGEELVGILDRARSLQIFGDGARGGGTLAFVHDRIMEAFSERIDPERRRELHLKIARALESLNEKNIDAALFDLAHHYIEGGDIEKSISYAFPAAMKSRANHAYRDALRYFRKTAELLERTGAAKSQLMADCVMEMGFICATIGEYDETITLLAGILPQVKGTSMEPRAHLAICNAYYRKGDWNKCEEHAAAGLSLLGERVPRTRPGVVSRRREGAGCPPAPCHPPGIFRAEKNEPVFGQVPAYHQFLRTPQHDLRPQRSAEAGEGGPQGAQPGRAPHRPVTGTRDEPVCLRRNLHGRPAFSRRP